MIPPWFTLLRQWQDANRFGLTVPFIYGAMDNWPGAPLGTDGLPEEKFTKMLRSIANGPPDGTAIRLFTCGTVRDLVLAPVFGAPDFCVSIESPNGLSPTLWVQQDLLDDGQNTCDALVEVLWVRYSSAIVEGRFSLQGGAYVAFTEADTSLIRLAQARLDDDDEPSTSNQ